MPTTLAGVLIFVVLLLPGFAYLVGKERNGTERHTSPFRETVAVVAASITSELVILALFTFVRWLRPTWTPNVGALIHGGSDYAADHYQSLTTYGLFMLVLAVLIAYLATVPRVRRSRLLKIMPIVRSYPHESTVSAWWMMFEEWKLGRDVKVGCILDDGSYVAGILKSFNNSADDSPDRDLVLEAPILYRPPGAADAMPHRVSAVGIPASKIVSMFVGYINKKKELEEELTPPPNFPAAPATPAPEAEPVSPAPEAAEESQREEQADREPKAERPSWHVGPAARPRDAGPWTRHAGPSPRQR
jgi:ribosomal protein L12E/L44/L45/RPP1/RPP2